MDLQYLLWLQSLRALTNNIFTNFFAFITTLGWSVLPYLIAIFIYWSLSKKHGRYILTTISLTDFIANVIKITACVYRPWIRSSEIQPVEAAKADSTGYSFPSGHTSVGTSLWGGIAVCNKKYPWIRNTCIALVLLIGFSRNYVGVHTPQDVLVAMTIACCMLWFSGKMLAWIDSDKKHATWFLIICVLIAVAVVVYANVKSYPMDYVDGKLLVDPAVMAQNGLGAAGNFLGFAVGLYLEQKYVQFSTDVSKQTKISRFIFGALVFIFLFYVVQGLLSTFMAAGFAKAISGFFQFFWIMYLYPCLFQKYEKKHPVPEPDAE